MDIQRFNFNGNNGLRSQQNPLLIHTILKQMMEYLLISDVKQFRLVCHTWNFIAELILRRGAQIQFSRRLSPQEFMEIQFNNLPGLPFGNFQFLFDNAMFLKALRFTQAWGINIKRLSFKRPERVVEGYTEFNLSPIIAIVANHLVEVEILNSEFKVDLDKLSSVKILTLRFCDVVVDSMTSRIAPKEIILQGIDFYQNEEKLTYVILNDFIDFSQCSHIDADFSFLNNKYFDLSRDVIDAKKIIFKDVRLINWLNTSIKTEYMKVSTGTFLASTDMIIGHLELKFCNADLSKIPVSVDKLTLVDNKFISSGNEPKDLPNLNCLVLVFPHTESFIRQDAIEKFHMISRFRNCANLTSIVLATKAYETRLTEVSLNWLPKSVQKIKFSRTLQFKLIAGSETIDVDILILQFCPCSVAETIMKRIRPKTLVISIMNLDDDTETIDILHAFVQRNKHLEKIIVAFDNKLKYYDSFEDTALSKCVNQNSTFYVFVNGLGKWITQYEFNKFEDL